MTLLYPSTFSESIRISTGTNLKYFDFSELLVLYEKERAIVPDTWYDVVNGVDNLQLVAFHIPVYEKDNKGRSRTKYPHVNSSVKTRLSIPPAPPPTMYVD